MIAERVGDLPSSIVAVAPTDSNRRVMELFEADPALEGVALVEHGKPTGLINRSTFYAGFARPYARELYLKRPCTTYADTQPLILDRATSVTEAGERIAAVGERALANGCIVVDGGAFAGLCSGVSLVRALSDLQGDQHRRLLSSIDYASTIQSALLADSRAALKAGFAERHQLIWRPRDVVGGDCFFVERAADGTLVGLMDCTGHGVPGALLTSIAISETGRLSGNGAARRSPGVMLARLSLRMKEALQQHCAAPDGTTQADDGMDAVFLWIGEGDPVVRIASARLPVFMLDRDGALRVLKGDRKGVGYRDTPADFGWTEHEVDRQDLHRLFLATDGLADQIGGVRGLPFGWSGLRRSLEQAADGSLEDQMAAAWSAFEGHQGPETRRDDVTVLALELS